MRRLQPTGLRTAAVFRRSPGLFLTALGFLATAFSAAASEPSAPIRYQLDLRQPASHLVRVQMTVSDAPPTLRIQFPAWNALYQIRDFVRHVQDLEGTCDGTASDLTAIDVDTWETGPKPCHELTVRYAVYANEESVFSAILNDQHAFLNLAQVLFYLPSNRSRGARVTFLLPEGWKLSTLLDQDGTSGEYTAPNYDRLADSPVEAGNFDEYSYRQGAAEYRIVVYSDEDKSKKLAPKLVEAVKKITAAETALMQDVPFQRYTFIFHFLPSGGGGMEHANGTAIGFADGELESNWEELEATIAHEFFHLWNVKRIRPQGLEPIDYIHGNDTRDLWFSEGITSTYEELVLVRSGLISRQRFYERLAGKIGAVEERPARRWESAELAGIDAWLEGYPDYFRPERSISYYDKGELLGFLLDLAMRQASQGRAGLDDLMRALNRDFAERGRLFQDTDLISLANRLTGGKLDTAAFFRDDVMGARQLDYQGYLGYAGLTLTQDTREVPDWGFRAVQLFGGTVQVESVEGEGPAEQAGLRPGDTISTLNGQPLTVAPDRVSGVKPGQRVELEVRRGSRKLAIKFQLGRSAETRYRIEENPLASADEVRLREGWLLGT
ncbi:MAG TPA: PDZ domain-containing protein [Terriglobia bacterium]